MDTFALITLLILSLVSVVTLLNSVLTLLILLRMVERVDYLWREIPENRQASTWITQSIRELSKRIEGLQNTMQYIARR